MPAVIFAFFQPRYRITTTILIGLAFVGLTFTINITHYAFSPDRKFMLSSLYYIYNFAVFLFVDFLFSKSPDKVNKITYVALATSILFELIVVILDYGNEVRAQGSFNNPNQLGYWSLLSFTLLIIVKRDKKINWFDAILIMSVFTMQALSLSKAGMISMLFCMIILFFSKVVSNTQRIITCILIIVTSIYIISFNNNLLRAFLSIDTIEAVYNRLSTIGAQGDDSLSGRGYDRIFENPHYLILGAGEGANWRYSVQNKELHSGLATLAFSYGIVGFITFFAFLYFVFRRRPWRHILLIIPIMLYGLTHQNVRFTYFWVVIAAAYAGRHIDRVDEEDFEDILLADDGNVGETPPRQETS